VSKAAHIGIIGKPGLTIKVDFTSAANEPGPVLVIQNHKTKPV
jgi:hypothetical protein